ncbi:MAG: hypothetical protein HYZ37_16580, partial [Candidatus Solibacter usitatus]|nr:hypothetical protein [Candidatus Solibacter usitatus]
MSIFAFCIASLMSAQSSDVKWVNIETAPIEVNGLPWFHENGGDLFRFPNKWKDNLPPAVWNLSKSPSGGRIRFRSDALRLALKLEYPGPPNMVNMHAFGQTGVDVYLDGIIWKTVVADKASAPGKVFEHVILDWKDKPRREHEVTIYLPLYKGVKVAGIGVDTGAKLTKPAKFAVDKPVVYYGTSITQGGCASRSGMAYPAIAGRMLNVDFVNLGFSGNGKGEAEVARAVAAIDAS